MTEGCDGGRLVNCAMVRGKELSDGPIKEHKDILE